MILITGAGGTVGSEVVRQLQATRTPFRAAYHNEKKAEAARANGIDATVIDYTRPETLQAAFDGVEKLFLLSGGAPDQTEREINAVDAAKAAGVRHIVKLSVIGAEGESYSFAKVHRPAEKAIESSGLTWTHLRPNGFMQNLQNYMIGTIASQGAFYTSVGDTRIAHVDVRDIAAVAVKVLTEPGHENRAYTLTGPAGVTYDEIAAHLSAASGRTISHVAVTDADVKAALVGSGAPEAYADAYLDLQRFYRSGAAANATEDVRRVTGRDPIPFEQYARDHASVFA
ncbi:MAG TPA: SDR family oxidoreductase [Thermoanaerobaculia bacterium]|jgi:uncharacterized protein YbjT (DUF2867 family)